MRLWTIQSAIAYEILKNEKVLRVNEKHIYEDFREAYVWMNAQMEKRLRTDRPYENSFPIWAWYQWQDETKKKPDLRYKGHLLSGEIGYRIEFEVSEDDVLLSDFLLFHHVINRWYIPKDENDDELFNKALVQEGIDALNLFSLDVDKVKVKYFKSMLMESWNRIFDLDWYDGQGYITFPRDQKSIQATLWELKLNQVKKVEKFISK